MEQSEIKQICERMLSFSAATEAEVIYHETAKALTRFANNQIEQNVAEVVANITFRGIWGRKTARVSTSRLDEGSLQRLVATAEKVARVQKDAEDLVTLPASQPYQPTDHDCAQTAAYTPEMRAAGVASHIGAVKERGLTAAGTFATGYQTIAIGNSKGLWAHDRFTEADFSTQVMGDRGSGYAAQTSDRAAAIDIAGLTERAIGKCVAAEDPRALDPGAYTVILEPAAVSNLLMFTGPLAFNALTHIEGRSPLNGRIGEQVVGDNITIEDNSFNELASGLPFDFEGVPRERVTLIDKGVLRRLVHDRRTAARMDCKSTGHGLPQPNTQGPWPFNLVLSPGDQSLEAMIRSTARGILVTQFHYTNVVNPMELSLTGMTRNGTFLIEDGVMRQAIKNMRFTESVLKAFSNVTAIGDELTLATSMFGGGYLVPALRIEDFTFSSATDF